MSYRVFRFFESLLLGICFLQAPILSGQPSANVTEVVELLLRIHELKDRQITPVDCAEIELRMRQLNMAVPQSLLTCQILTLYVPRRLSPSANVNFQRNISSQNWWEHLTYDNPWAVELSAATELYNERFPAKESGVSRGLYFGIKGYIESPLELALDSHDRERFGISFQRLSGQLGRSQDIEMDAANITLLGYPNYSENRASIEYTVGGDLTKGQEAELWLGVDAGWAGQNIDFLTNSTQEFHQDTFDNLFFGLFLTGVFNIVSAPGFNIAFENDLRIFSISRSSTPSTEIATALNDHLNDGFSFMPAYIASITITLFRR